MALPQRTIDMSSKVCLCFFHALLHLTHPLVYATLNGIKAVLLAQKAGASCTFITCIRRKSKDDGNSNLVLSSRIRIAKIIWMPIYLHQCKIYTILYSIAYFVYTYRSGTVWNLQILKKIQYFKNLYHRFFVSLYHRHEYAQFIKMFATIFIPLWAGGWTRRYSEGSSELTHAMILYKLSLSRILCLHNHYSTPRHAQNQMRTLCEKAYSTDLSAIHIYSLFGTQTQNDHDHTWPSGHKQPGIYCSFSFPRHSVLYTNHLAHCLSQIIFLLLLSVTFLFNSPKIFHYFLLNHKFFQSCWAFMNPKSIFSTAAIIWNTFYPSG